MAVKKRVLKESFFASPLYDFLSPFRPVASQWYAEYIIVLFSLVIRCAVGLGSFSGESTPPMYGDFEAQRHWMELTVNLPISKWYWYDLPYWGLDYPPLTAYHSYVLGLLGSLLNPNWFQLDSSRGSESQDLKSFMRFTVVLSEALLYIPAVIYFTKWVGKRRGQSPIGQYIAAAAILFQPSLILIDHGHFQYNSVMLGLTVYAINNLLDGFYAPAAICFVLSFTFKQMALYYSPIFFAYMLSKSLISPSFNLPRLFGIAIATVLSFGAIFAPLYLFGGLYNVLQSVHRIFPFARGIFEDKVANFWCVSNVLLKYNEKYTQIQLQKYSLYATVAGLLPAFALVFFYPKKHMLPYGLAACSMSFFLFSFQVHEKSILVPLLPISLLYCSTDWDVLSMVSWINNVALFTLWPLIKKDGLILQYGVLMLLSNWLIGNFSFVTPRFLPHFLTPGPSVSKIADSYRRRSLLPGNILWKFIIISSYCAMAVIHVLDLFVLPPKKYPDLWVLLNCALGFGCFGLFWLWTYYQMFRMRNKTLYDL
ncbi:ALI_HP2_G0042940.mRNA.1.CDS.1 [Saccharomyces cerevisiae]|nr:ALI_HP2_G0042940.mRNA.1.CDS.1 [Saccharomyces cerevisiae]CAI6642576.1 ALI_HP2_G0042940.mRNA.1.CDS.1 [Saccharomyces cerevisiae]CAI6700726.1 ALI_collapsed_G0018220.mRNA.1.CDS.1 [Saccharomyces cerevisiae]